MNANEREFISEEEAMKRLRALIRKHGSQAKLAMAYGLCPTHISQSLSGRCGIPRALLPALGLRAVRGYAEVPAP